MLLSCCCCCCFFLGEELPLLLSHFAVICHFVGFGCWFVLLFFRFILTFVDVVVIVGNWCCCCLQFASSLLCMLRTVERLIELVRVESNVVVCMVVFVKSCVKREIKPLFECPGIWSQQFYVCLSLMLLLINQLWGRSPNKVIRKFHRISKCLTFVDVVVVVVFV